MNKIGNMKKIMVVFYPVVPLIIGFLIVVFFIAGFNLGIAMYIILGVVQLAVMIYVWVVLTEMSADINLLCKEDGEHLMPWICALLLGVISFGVYYTYYLYKTQNRLQALAERKGIQIKESGNTVLLWSVLRLQTLGMSTIIIMNFIVKGFNKCVDDYNGISVGGGKKHISESKGHSARLEFISGAMKGATVDLSGGESIVVGRDPDYANFVIDEKSEKKISRRHCTIRCDASNGNIYITDHSSNGTYISGKGRIPKGIEMQIERGSIVQLSETTKFKVK